MTMNKTKDEILIKSGWSLSCTWDQLRGAAHSAMQQFSDQEVAKAKDEWVSVEDRTPELIPGKDYSENVFAILGGKLRVMAYCYIDDDEDSGYAWCDCMNDIYGDPEFDDNYYPTHWMSFPKLPSPPVTE